jgi:hypothetical protein
MEFDFKIQFIRDGEKEEIRIGMMSQSYWHALHDVQRTMFEKGHPWKAGDSAVIFLVTPVLNKEDLILGYRHKIGES